MTDEENTEFGKIVFVEYLDTRGFCMGRIDPGDLLEGADTLIILGVVVPDSIDPKEDPKEGDRVIVEINGGHRLLDVPARLLTPRTSQDCLLSLRKALIEFFTKMGVQIPTPAWDKHPVKVGFPTRGGLLPELSPHDKAYPKWRALASAGWDFSEAAPGHEHLHFDELQQRTYDILAPKLQALADAVVGTSEMWNLVLPLYVGKDDNAIIKYLSEEDGSGERTVEIYGIAKRTLQK